MPTKKTSALPIVLALAAFALPLSEAAVAAPHHAAKPAAGRKAAASEPAGPTLAAETAVAQGAPALPAKAWLLMDYDSGQVLAAANPDESLPQASLTKMMTSFL